MREYQICTRCVMDTTAKEIEFDASGECSFCRSFDQVKRKRWMPGPEGQSTLDRLVKEMQEAGKGKPYDCVIGLSGGIDSSYLAYYCKRVLGLRPLAVHVDAGWNSEVSVKNIEQLVSQLDIDLFTYVVDWDEMKDLQLAYLRSGLANQDVPQDHAFFAMLFRYAVQNKIKYVLTGSNIATESVLPKSWGYYAMDTIQLQAIHRRFGEKRLSTYPRISLFNYYIGYPLLRGMKVLAPLNYLPYDKERAMQVLTSELGWRYYGGKHHESTFTKFFQSYFLPERFGYDKRRAHYSSLILAGQMTREEALSDLEKPAYDPAAIKSDQAYVIKKLGISEADFEQFMKMPVRDYTDYPSFESMWYYRLAKFIWRDLLGR